MAIRMMIIVLTMTSIVNMVTSILYFGDSHGKSGFKKMPRYRRKKIINRIHIRNLNYLIMAGYILSIATNSMQPQEDRIQPFMHYLWINTSEQIKWNRCQTYQMLNKRTKKKMKKAKFSHKAIRLVYLKRLIIEFISEYMVVIKNSILLII